MCPNTLAYQLQPYGLRVLSQLQSPGELQAEYPWANSLLLVGQGGHGYWPVFSQSPEYHDSLPDPIDRWSQRIGGAIANELQGVALYPFTGPPYWPFLTWSQAAGDSATSRLGMHLHRTYGLWHSYRFGLLLPEPVKSDHAAAYQTPCHKCDQPCWRQCPVDAFAQQEQYQVQTCRSYILANQQSLCVSEGCQARQACPEGCGSHEPAQQQYHMQVFANG